MRWEIRGYVPSGTESVIDEWLRTAPVAASAKFEARIRFLRDRNPGQWRSDYAHHLKDRDGIFEIRFETRNIAYRPICCYGPARLQFTILIFAVEHNDNLRPSGALDTAETRKEEVGNGRAHTTEYDPD